MKSWQGLGCVELRSALGNAQRVLRKQCQVNIHRSLLNACVEFMGKGYRIASAVVLSRLRVALKELGIVSRPLQIRTQGEIRALEMLVRFRIRGIFGWAPKLEMWLRDPRYIFWLGMTQSSPEREYTLAADRSGPRGYENC